jgi:hypothetical protein
MNWRGSWGIYNNVDSNRGSFQNILRQTDLSNVENLETGFTSQTQTLRV